MTLRYWNGWKWNRILGEIGDIRKCVEMIVLLSFKRDFDNPRLLSLTRIFGRLELELVLSRFNT